MVWQRRDYGPFGEELETTSRTAILGYGTGGQRHRFTSKERDAETGLDYFDARYFSAAQGRFTSPDEFTGGAVDAFTGGQVGVPGPLPYADITNPQSLNKYAYVMNSPLRYTDPQGHCAGALAPICMAGNTPIGQRITSIISSNAEKFAVGAFAILSGAMGAIAEAHNNYSVGTPDFQGGPNPEIMTQNSGAAVNDMHAPGDVPDRGVIVRGGQAEMPPAGTTFSGSQGSTTSEAGKGVPHGTIRESTAGAILAGGGSVTVKPDPTKSGTLNPQHVNVVEGRPTFSAPKPNPVPKKERIE